MSRLLSPPEFKTDAVITPDSVLPARDYTQHPGYDPHKHTELLGVEEVLTRDFDPPYLTPDPSLSNKTNTTGPPLLDLHKWFQTIQVVNLLKFPKRWELFQQRATVAGITGYERFHAIEGDRVGPPGWFRGGNGAWGCLMSHLRIAQDAMMTGDGHFLVFEDDAVFSSDFAERLPRIMDEVGDDWDMLYLGGQHLHQPRVKPKRHPKHKEVIIAGNINRTHAFAINSRFRQKYISHIMYAQDYIESKHSMHIDHQLGQLHEHQGYNILCAQPWINGQSAGKSWTGGKETREMWWQIKEDNILNNV